MGAIIGIIRGNGGDFMAKKPRLGLQVIYSLSEGKQSMQSLVGAAANDYSITSGIDYVTVMSAEGKASIDGDTLYLEFPDTPETSQVTVNGDKVGNFNITADYIDIDTSTHTANITIVGGGDDERLPVNLICSPSDVTLTKAQSVTITVDSNSPAPITSYSCAENVVIIESISPNEVVLTGNTYNASKTTVNFHQIDTQKYRTGYYDLPVTIEQSNTLKGLFHFNNNLDDSSGSGYEWKFTFQSNTYTYVHGHFGDAVNGRFLLTANEFYLGGQDFTIDFWLTVGYYTENLLEFGTADWFCYVHQAGTATINLTNHNSIALEGSNGAFDNSHIAYCYNHAEKTLKMFINGTLKATFTDTNLTRGIATFTPYNGNWLHPTTDELHIEDGIAQWSTDFTPPTEPYQ